MGLFDFFFKKKEEQPEQTEQPITPPPSAETNFVDELEAAGYFKYAAAADLPELKKAINEGLKYNMLDSIFFEKEYYHSKDYRIYGIDGEVLFEPGGFIDALKDFERIFHIIGLKFEVTNDIEEFDEEKESKNHSLTVNGKEYVIFKNFSDGYGHGWAQSAREFALMLNDQLDSQGKDERIYLYQGGNDGQAVLLTEKQLHIIDKFISDPNGKPLKLGRWCTYYKV